MSTQKRLADILKAVQLQAEDPLLWQSGSIHEAYIVQSLRWLHAVIEGDATALASITEQSEENR